MGTNINHVIYSINLVNMGMTKKFISLNLLHVSHRQQCLLFPFLEPYMGTQILFIAKVKVYEVGELRREGRSVFMSSPRILVH